MRKFLMIAAMFVLACSIEVGAHTLATVSEVEINGSLNEIGQTATITHPALRVAKKDDAVKIDLIYKDGLGNEVYRQTEFEGFVKRVSPNRPYKVECVDYLLKLQNKNINKAWRETTLKEVLNEIISGTQISLIGDVPSIDFTKFRLSNLNGAEALDKIKKEYGLMVYLRYDKLFVGLAYTEDIGTTEFKFGKNIVQNDLTFVSEDEVKLKVKVKSILKDNTIVEAEAGPSDGAERTITVYNITDKKVLENRAKDEIKKLTYSGFEGSITGFLAPYATFGTVIDLVDDLYTERSGKYICESVNLTFGDNGARRKMQLGIKVSV